MPVWWWDFLAMLTSKTITHLISNLLSNHRIIWEIVSNCVAFLENLSFKMEKIWSYQYHLHPQWKFKLWVEKFPRSKGKTLLGVANKLLKTKILLTSPSNVFLLPQLNFHTNNLNFYWRWRWWDWIQAILLNFWYFAWYLYLCVHQRPPSAFFRKPRAETATFYANWCWVGISWGKQKYVWMRTVYLSSKHI